MKTTEKATSANGKKQKKSMSKEEMLASLNREELLSSINREQLDSGFFSVEEVAEYWRVKASGVYILIRTGRLRACKICGKWRISPEAIKAYEEENTRRQDPSVIEELKRYRSQPYRIV